MDKSADECLQRAGEFIELARAERDTGDIAEAKRLLRNAASLLALAAMHLSNRAPARAKPVDATSCEQLTASCA